MIRTSVSIGGSRISDHDFTSISLDQRMGAHHSFEIRLRQDAKKDMLMERTKAWVGQTVSLGFDFHKDIEIDAIPVKEQFQGIVTSISLSRRQGMGELVVKGYSPTIVLDDGNVCRSFTDTGLQEIVDKVMSPYEKVFSEKPEISPSGFTSTIDYTVQYRENAYSFIRRLANQYGEWFFYDGIKLYFGKPKKENSILMDFDDKGLKYFDLSLAARPMKMEIKAYDYRKDELVSSDVSEYASTNDYGLEIHKKSQDIFKEKTIERLHRDTEQKELKHIAKIKAGEASQDVVVLNGVSGNCQLGLGKIVEIQDKSLGEKYGKYMITSVRHNIGQGGDYSNSFQAVPTETEVPPVTSSFDPPFCETQVGVVTDVDDPDSLGRVQVQLKWQDGNEKTPWIRVASPYAGSDKGLYIIPDVNDQVMVAFEDGNPLKPYVLSGMYHAKAKPELFNPKNDLKGFKSREQNTWLFNDAEKSILLSAPQKLDLHAGKEINLKTDGADSSSINLEVGDGTITIKAKSISIDASDEITINTGKTFELNSGQKLAFSAGTDLIQEGANIKSSATANNQVEGKAVVVVKGGVVKIN
jgi:Rhs element Vgr protein